MGKVSQLWQEIRTPAQEFSPIPFWFFNDTSREDWIREQFQDYQRKGVSAIVLHPRIGIPEEVPYLSEAYFKAVRFIVKTAAQLGMKIVLYDEGMYPSGSAHGQVVAENSALAARGITVWGRTEGEEQQIQIGEDSYQVLARLSKERILIYGASKGTIRGIHFGEDDGEAGAPRAADILNPEAVATFIRLTHDRYYEELQEYFGTTVIGFFTDEPCALGRNAPAFREWAEGMEEELAAAGGRLEDLIALFEGTENESTRIYHKLIKKHLRETFYRPISEWCHAHGIDLYGHPAESDDVEEAIYFQVPGQDLILRRVEPMTGGLVGKDSVQAKLTADLARHLGRRRNLNECFGVCSRRGQPWYFTGEDMKWYIDWLGLRGVNLFVPHAFYYSLAGKRKEERPPDVGPHNIWWEYYSLFTDYMKRLSCLMTDSEECAQVAVLCDNNRVPAEPVAALYENQIGFHYLPAAFLDRCRVEGGCLRMGANQYAAVLNTLGEAYDGLLPKGVPVVRDAQELLEKTGEIREWETEKIGVVESTGAREMTGMVENAGKTRVRRILETDRPVKALRAVHRQKEGVDFFFLCNEGREPLHFYMKAKELTAPVRIDLWQGRIERCPMAKAEGTDWFAVDLQPCESCLLLSDPEGELAAESREIDRELPADWTDRFRLQKKEGNRRFYQYSFAVKETDQGGKMAFRVQAEEMVECWCNGRFAGVSFWNPHCFKIGDCLKEGTNELRLVVTGNAANLYAEGKVFFGLKNS